MRFETQQVHAGQTVDGAVRARAQPIYASNSFVFQDSQNGADLFGLKAEGYIYSRITNPTNQTFEERVAALEGGTIGTATSSGQAAQFIALSSLCGVGDNFVASPYLYGGTYNQLKNYFKKFGVEGRFVSSNDPKEFALKIDSKTKAIFVESIGNPLYIVPDFEALSKLAHDNGIPLVVDNTFGAAGFVIQPFKHGADIIVHSASKWINGHGTSISGVIVDSGKFPWADYPEKFPNFSEKSDAYHGSVFNELFGKDAFSFYCKLVGLRDAGPCLNPFASFLNLQGLETLSLRVERQSENALKLAKYLEKSPYIKSVSYLGLPSHPSHELSKKYLRNQGIYGACLAVEVKPFEKKVDNPFQEAAPKVVDNLKFFSNLANVGDSKSLVVAPYFTTHEQLSEKERLDAGITKELIRLSIGTEHIDDLIEDFEQSFKTVYN